MTIWYILCSFGTFFPFLVSYTKKNLANQVPAPAPTPTHTQTQMKRDLRVPTTNVLKFNDLSAIEVSPFRNHFVIKKLTSNKFGRSVNVEVQPMTVANRVTRDRCYEFLNNFAEKFSGKNWHL
jgi:hypothetical protein